MIHFTSIAFIAIAEISGLDGQYGSTTVLVGVFNTRKRAEAGILQYSIDFIKAGKCKEIDINCKIYERSTNKVDPVSISKVYE